MAAAETDVLQPLKRNQSYEFLPPFMSELRVVLLGNSWSERSSVGNLILGKSEFNTEKEPETCLRVQGQIQEKDLVLINTPDLLHPNISEDKLTEDVTDCVRLSDPGPHVFLLVLQPEDFSEEQKLRLCRILEQISDQSFDRSLILISAQRGDSSSFLEKLPSDRPLRDMIELCKYRRLQQEKTDLPELFTRLVQTAKENSGQLTRCTELEGEDAGLFVKPKSVCEHMKPLNLVLCGRRGAGKTSAAEVISGQTGLHPASSSSGCVKRQGEVCGHRVSLVELPALCGEPLETVMEESLRCVSLCDPEGVHAFILVLPVGPLTDEDKGELKIIEDTFSSQVDDFTMILFATESDPKDPAVVGFVKKNNAIQELVQSCGERHFVLNIKDQQQIPELLSMVEKMTMKRTRCFSKDLFIKAQMTMVLRLRAELQVVNQRSERGGADEIKSRECLRMVLIGKTGSEKHTILGKDLFESGPELKTCQVANSEIDGEPVVVVNTPALTSSDFHSQMKNCLSMFSPGPHVFLLVLQIGNFTQEEKHSVELIQRVFGKKSEDFIIILFTKGEELAGQSFESHIEEHGDFLRQLIDDCGGRYQVFNDKENPNHTQAKELLTKIKTMVKENGGCYNTERLEDIDGFVQTHVQKIIQEKEGEILKKEEELRREHQEDSKTLRKTINDLRSEMERERKMKAKQLKEKDECINTEREQRKKEKDEEERKRKKQEENLRQEWRRKLEASEMIVQSERQLREDADRKFERHRKEMRKDRESWEKEIKNLWERIQQENKQNLEEEKKCHRNLQNEYNYKRRKWTFCFFVLSLLFFWLLFYLFFTRANTAATFSPETHGH